MSSAPIEPRELARRIARGDALVLLDVREPAELAICRIRGSRAIPLGELARRAGELDPDQPIVCICHHGIRSANAAAVLAAQGFESVFNLSGGIERWALEVDPSLARY